MGSKNSKDKTKTKKIVRISLIVAGALLCGWILFVVITKSIVLDDCASSCSRNEKGTNICTTACVNYTLYDKIMGVEYDNHHIYR